jgi:hypothetical protein
MPANQKDGGIRKKNRPEEKGTPPPPPHTDQRGKVSPQVLLVVLTEDTDQENDK